MQDTIDILPPHFFLRFCLETLALILLIIYIRKRCKAHKVTRALDKKPWKPTYVYINRGESPYFLFFDTRGDKHQGKMIKVNEEIHQYIVEKIYPLYEDFGRSHDCFHFSAVYKNALTLSQHFDVNQDMVAMAAACHDLGITEGRETHHLASGRIIRANQDLRRWFTEDQIETIAQAAEDHRASSDHEPRSIYGKIVADADHLASMSNIIQRTVEYSLEYYPELDKEGHWQRCRQHLREKYSDEGYLKVWLPDVSNTNSLELLRDTIKDEEKLRRQFNEIYSKISQD